MFESLGKASYNGPPKFPIANKFYMGILPNYFTLTRTKLAMTTLAQNNVWLSIVKSEQNHRFCSPSYAFGATLTPPTTLLLANIATMGCFKVSIVGALTLVQFIAITKKYFVRNVAFTNILDF
jgi:hypothetical protein